MKGARGFRKRQVVRVVEFSQGQGIEGKRARQTGRRCGANVRLPQSSYKSRSEDKKKSNNGEIRSIYEFHLHASQTGSTPIPIPGYV
jgi:hypothetical protein